MPAPPLQPGGNPPPAWRTQFDNAQAAKTANVVCMKWGTRYGPEWVNRLYAMVARNTSWKIRFVCFTDDGTGIRPEVECQPLPPVRIDPRAGGKYWPKLGLMRDDLGGLAGMTLALDLDLVVLGNIDDFFTYPGRFCIIREWKNPHLGYGNSSVTRHFVGLEGAVLDRFYETPPEVLREKYNSLDQNFLTKAVDEVTFWPDDWCVPFPRRCLPRNRVLRFFATPKRPETGKILIFYGSITPETAMRGEHEIKKRVATGLHLRPTRRRFRPAPWIAEYWKE